MNQYLIPSLRAAVYITLAMVLGGLWAFNTEAMELVPRFAYAAIFCGSVSMVLWLIAIKQEHDYHTQQG